MALSRLFQKLRYSLEREPIDLYGSFKVDGAGAVTFTQGGGIQSITRNSAGKYTVVLSVPFIRVLAFDARVVDPAVQAVNHFQLIGSQSTFHDDAKAATAVVVQCLNESAAAADPAATSLILFHVVVRRSAASPYDK